MRSTSCQTRVEQWPNDHMIVRSHMILRSREHVVQWSCSQFIIWSCAQMIACSSELVKCMSVAIWTQVFKYFSRSRLALPIFSLWWSMRYVNMVYTAKSKGKGRADSHIVSQKYRCQTRYGIGGSWTTPTRGKEGPVSTFGLGNGITLPNTPE